MYTKFELCSNALIKIGGSPISSFSDGTTESQVAANLYPVIKRSELSAYAWTWNTFFRQLSRNLETPPDPNWRYMYEKPVQCLKIIAAYGKDGNQAEYRLEGNYIYSNDPAVSLRYHADVNEDTFTALFADALICKLAYEFNGPITNQTAESRALWVEYEEKFRRAKHHDAAGHTSPSLYNNGSWVLH